VAAHCKPVLSLGRPQGPPLHQMHGVRWTSERWRDWQQGKRGCGEGIDEGTWTTSTSGARAPAGQLSLPSSQASAGTGDCQVNYQIIITSRAPRAVARLGVRRPCRRLFSRTSALLFFQGIGLFPAKGGGMAAAVKGASHFALIRTAPFCGAFDQRTVPRDSVTRNVAQGPILALRHFTWNLLRSRGACKTSPALPRSGKHHRRCPTNRVP
jgi:hypothetical protein